MLPASTINASSQMVAGQMKNMGFEEPKRVDKQVDVPFTVGALSHLSSTSINASIEEVQVHCQSTTLQDRMTTSTFSLREGNPMYPGKYPYPLMFSFYIN
jgi:hypothetical protein